MRHARAVLRLLPAVLLLALLVPPGAAPAQEGGGEQFLLDAPDEPIPAHDFTAETAAGETVRLSELRGNLVLLNFWATWCEPCLREMPSMGRLQEAMAGRPFRILAVNLLQTPEQVRSFADEYDFGFPLLLDADGEISDAYGVNRIPVSYLIDAQGRVVRRAIGDRAWDSEAAVDAIEGLLPDGGAQG